MDTSSQPVAAASHGWRSGAASPPAPPDAWTSSMAGARSTSARVPLLPDSGTRMSARAPGTRPWGLPGCRANGASCFLSVRARPNVSVRDIGNRRGGLGLLGDVLCCVPRAVVGMRIVRDWVLSFRAEAWDGRSVEETVRGIRARLHELAPGWPSTSACRRRMRRSRVRAPIRVTGGRRVLGGCPVRRGTS
jgi:hypothetical protein